MFSKAKIKNFSSLEDIFKAFEDLRVLIIGDVMIDSYIWGKVDRISPEAPVPILNVQKREQRLGGAANVALNVQSLGATPILCSIIGNDLEGNNFLSLLSQSNLSTEGIIRSDSRITTIKHRIISGAHHMLRVDQEEDHFVNDVECNQLLSRIKTLVQNCDVVIFEDYDKGVLRKEIIEEVITYSQSKAIPTVVDPKKRNFLHYKGATLFKPNRKELKEGLKIDDNLSQIKEVEKAVDLLQKQLDIRSVLITLSEKGIYISQEKEKHHLPAHVREISDVSGAGDTVVSIAALCQALQLPPRLLAALSNLGGGIVCEYVGVVPIKKNILFEEAKKLQLI